MNVKGRAIIVVGMHRSGTSCLAGIVQAAGVDLGEVSKANAFNRKGNRENPRVMRLHEAVLAASGGSWDEPPRGVDWPPELESERDAIIASFAPSPVWGFKDPRTLLVANGWLRALEEVSLLGTFRNPRSVAQSLQRRNGFDAEKSFRLWQIHNEHMLGLWNRLQFPIVDFDLPAAEYLSRVGAALDLVGLQQVNGSLDFFEDELRRYDVDASSVPPRAVLALHDTLRSVSAGLLPTLRAHRHG